LFYAFISVLFQLRGHHNCQPNGSANTIWGTWVALLWRRYPSISRRTLWFARLENWRGTTGSFMPKFVSKRCRWSSHFCV